MMRRIESLRLFTLISGFCQHTGAWNGILELGEKLRDGQSDCVSDRVQYFRWNQNWSHVADYYLALSQQYEIKPDICVFAYSWGGGWGAPRLACELGKRGLSVRHMVLSDPVYCHPWLTFRWRALTNYDWPFVPQPVIKIPRNVGEVWTFHQIANRPAGHRLVARNGAVIHPRTLIQNTTHQFMDDCWSFHQKCLELADELRGCDDAR